ncbi:MAG TPA: aminotransferase class III-fold pyridoxal phosphate-dependent enzyme [Anaerolineae bacterium]|nr:aminotransferase class III-fold pyridoxal phosphate-dependent enzyme [Anaerolineae bacterium]HQH38333.1 aminotransferase class III-fold pyridoxal phosphate-dependent enzyme [Anaerolineae bacterium]
MKTRDYTSLLGQLKTAYTARAPQSAALNARALDVMVDGGSHALRLLQPFPPRITAAHGAWLTDEDGHAILDFWQGHLANILGHNPTVITSVLASTFATDLGLQTGFTDRLQVETAEILCERTGAERVRFTTSGTLATMYAILLARAFTGRDGVLKVGGGWHGGQPWALKGVNFHHEQGFQHVETLGLSSAMGEEVAVTRFNDPEMLSNYFRQSGDRLACFIVEPFMGSGGYMPATREYLHTARELTARYGAVLIFDEVIAGFRFRAGDTGALYGIQPDLATFGKIIGGGMPVAAVTGRADIMNLAGRAGGSRVKFSGGTYSAHPASMLAAKTMLHYLVEHEAEVYPRLAVLGNRIRHILEEAFMQEGFYTRCTGWGNDALPGSSIFMVNFPYQEEHPLDAPDDVFDPAVCDVVLSGEVLPLALLLEDVYTMHGHGVASTAHTEADLAFLEAACHNVARHWRQVL